MTDVQLFDDEVDDKYARENFVRIRRAFKEEPLLKGQFKFYEVALQGDKATTYPHALSFVHNLGFIPKDVLVLRISPDTETVTWQYDSFDRQRVYLTISNPVTIRAFIGRYQE